MHPARDDADARVLVVGGDGFVGRALARELVAERIDVWIADTRVSGRQEGLARERAVDVTDTSAVEALVDEARPDAVVHLAAALTQACRDDPVAGVEVNCLGATNVFQAAVRARVPRVVFTSSVAVFGARQGADAVTEETRPRPSSVYGATKAFQEQLAIAFGELQQETRFVGLRLGWVYGPGRTRGWTEFQEMIEGFAVERETVPCPRCEDLMDWTYVDDAVGGVVACLRAREPRLPIYNLRGDIRPVTDAVALLQRLFPSVAVRWYESRLPEVAWGYSGERIQNELGYSSTTRLEVGLVKTLQSIRTAAGLPAVAVAGLADR